MKRIEIDGLIDEIEGEMPSVHIERRPYGVQGNGEPNHCLFVTLHGGGFEATRRLSRYEAKRLLQGLKAVVEAWPEKAPVAARAAGKEDV